MNHQPTEPPADAPTDPAVAAALTAEWRKAMEDRLDRGSERMELFDEKLERNTAMTADVHEILMACRVGLNYVAKFGRGLGWIGTKFMRIARWGATVAAPIIGAVALVWNYFHGKPPTP